MLYVCHWLSKIILLDMLNPPIIKTFSLPVISQDRNDYLVTFDGVNLCITVGYDLDTPSEDSIEAFLYQAIFMLTSSSA